MSWRGKEAVHALPNTLNKKAEGLLEPLLEGEEDDGYDEEYDVELEEEVGPTKQ